MPRPNADEHLPAPAFGPGPIPHGHAPHGQFMPTNQFAPNPFAVATPTVAPPAGHRMLPTILELVSSFRRRWVISLMIGSVMAVVAAIAIWMMMPSGKHQAQAVIRYKSSSEGAGGRQLDTIEFDRWVKAQIKEMQTKQLATRVAQAEAIKKMMQGADDPAKSIQDMIKIKQDGDEHVNISINGNEGDQIKMILEEYIAQYSTFATEKEETLRAQTLLSYKTALETLNKQIEERKKVLMDLVAKQGGEGNDELITRISVESSIKTRSDSLDAQVAAITVLGGKLELEKAKLANGKVEADAVKVQNLIDTSPVVQLKLVALQNADLLLQAGRAKYAEDSDVVRERLKAFEKVKKEYEDAGKSAAAAGMTQLIDEAKKVKFAEVQKLQEDYDLALKTKVKTEDQLNILKKQLQDMKKAGQQIKNDNMDIDPLVEQRNQYLKKLTELTMFDQNKVLNSRFEVVEGAQLYLDFNFKQKVVFAVLAGLGAMLTVMVIIAYLEWRNRRVDGVDQVVQELGMRVIGTIPAFPSRAALRSGEASQNQNWRFILNESVNSTRTMLLHTARTQQMQVILVTSAMQGEGKTSLSSQLATSMATAGLRTLILDCDLRNPSMQKLFDIPVAPGCAEILLQEIDISDAVQPTSVPNLWIIPAGQCNHRVIAALAQGHPLEGLFNRLRGQFDIIVVDSCPILPVADTLLVAQHVDGVVFSILQDVSQLPKVQDASERLIQLNIPLVGAVVNGIKPDIQAYGYNYVKQLPA